MTRIEARELFYELTESPSLIRHARTVELVMEALAKHHDEDVEKWAITGMLHDADYDKYPDKHPDVIVKKLRDLGEDEIAHAIAGHYTKWDVPRESLLDKAIVAADELTGFIVAVALVRPTRIEGMKVRSVMKKLKTEKFAEKVDRDEVYKGAELLGWDIKQLIQFIIDVLKVNRHELDLAAPRK
jgi:predicted hydrolase (HD superfamily)